MVEPPGGAIGLRDVAGLYVLEGVLIGPRGLCGRPELLLKEPPLSSPTLLLWL
jgi:hypothetical protein